MSKHQVNRNVRFAASAAVRTISIVSHSHRRVGGLFVLKEKKGKPGMPGKRGDRPMTKSWLGLIFSIVLLAPMAAFADNNRPEFKGTQTGPNEWT